MKIQFGLIFLLWCSASSALSQDLDDTKMYEWEIARAANPDTIYGITFEKLKLESLPMGLEKYWALRELNLEKNRLTELPNFIADFKNLEEINIGKNRLDNFPIQICRMPNLKRLILNRNFFESIPDCIANAKQLVYLDLYDCPITNLPEGLGELKNLEEIDFSGIRFSPAFQKKWTAKLPSVNLLFDAPCDCMK